MSVEALVLASASAIRPLSMAAVYAMLSAARPGRLLMAYVAAGFVFSAGIGILRLVILLGVSADPGSPDEERTVIPLVLGTISLSYAAALLNGSVKLPVPDPGGAINGPDASSWLGRQLTDLSPRRAALAGVLTHLPGLFYFAALSAITNSTPSNANRMIQVALYNAIWFAIPMAALVLVSCRPVELQQTLQRTTAWVWRRQRETTITAFGVVGVYLIVKGSAALQS